MTGIIYVLQIKTVEQQTFLVLH